MEQIKCPYCQATLIKIPSRKTACVNCKKNIYVRTSPKTRKKVYVTEKGAKELDEEWKKYSSLSNQIYYVRQMVGETEFNLEKEKLRAKFKQEPSDNDVAWGILNHLVLKANNLQELKEIYYQMALFLNADGKDCTKVRQETARIELEDYKKLKMKRVKVLAGSNSCEACKEQAKKIFTLEEALELNPVPCKSCSYTLFPGSPPFCRCLYTGYWEDYLK